MRADNRRIALHEKLPLEAPLSLHVFPSYYCNFRCSYCLHSLSEEKLHKLSFKKQFMEFETYRKAIDSLEGFGSTLKALVFAGHGEPLMHKDIAAMVAYAKKNKVAERVEIVTNASLLHEPLSEKLIEAGLDRLRISIQGVSMQKYRDISGIDIDFEKLVKKISYFHSLRKATEVYIKIIDIAIEDESEKNKFYELFAPLSDTATIEYTIPFIPELNYNTLSALSARCKQGHQRSSHICSMPFYMLVVEPNGAVLPCCSAEIPLIYGTVQKNSLCEMWNSEVRRSFLQMQLVDRTVNRVCRRCSVPAYGLQEGDYLDDHVEKLIRLFNA